MNVGKRVTLKGTNLSGTVQGTATVINPEYGHIKMCYVLLLDEGFYNPERNTYISMMLVHFDSLQD